MKWTKITGLIAATFTPLNADGTLNLALIEPYVQHLLSHGVKHVYVNGTTGEFASLTVEERKLVAEAWIKHGKSKLDRIIIQCGGGNLSETKELVKHAASIGADCIAVVGPTYFKPVNTSFLIPYLSEAAKVAPDTPFMYYHFPGQTGINVRITEFLKEAHDKIPNLIGVKFTSTDFQDAMTASLLFKEKYDIIVGTDGMILGALAMGMKSFIGITFTIVGKTCNRLIKAFESGNLALAREEQNRVNEFLMATHKIGCTNALISSLKATVPLYFPTLKLGPTRSPIVPITNGQADEIKKKLEALHFKEWI